MKNSKSTTHTLILTAFFMLVSLCANAGDPIEKMKKKLVGGTWKFSHHWNPYKNNGEPGWKSSDPKLLNIAYTFYEDGTVVLWSLDNQAQKLLPTKFTWGIVYVETSKGKKVANVKIVDSSIDPKNQQAIEASTSGNSFYIVQLSSTFFTWIPIPQYKTINSRDTQNAYKKSPDMPSFD